MPSSDHVNHVSLSALLDWNKCQRRHYLAHTRHLRPIARAPALGSGSAVHAALANWLTAFPTIKPTADEIVHLAVGGLRGEFGDDETKYGKYVKGAANSLSLVPDWIWERRWESETDVTIVLDRDADWQVHGRTDIWSMSDEGIDLLDFKVSDSNPRDLMLWSPQIRYYALGLQQTYPDRMIHYKYLLLPTQGKRACDPFSWPFTRAVADRTLSDLIKLVRDYQQYLSLMPHEIGKNTNDIGWQYPRPAYDRSACGFCPYNPICIAEITGADRAAVQEEQFVEVVRNANARHSGAI